MFFAIVAPDRRHDSELLGVAHRVFHQALGLDVEAHQQAHRSKCTASLGRMPAWSRGCLLAHMVCSVVPHAREVKNSCVSGIEAEGWHVSGAVFSFSSKETRMKPLQKEVRKATATIASLIE